MIYMGYKCDFFCPKCDAEWEDEWIFGSTVTCPECRTEWETEYEEDMDCNIQGPWITKECI